jgi:hypothetical protein
MSNRILRHAPTLFVTMHCFLWGAVMVVWILAWRVEPVPGGPPFNFAKKFIGRIDCVGSGLVEVLSVKLALAVAKYLGTDLGLSYAIFFGVLILLAGTFQWFALGWLTRRLADKYGKKYATFLCFGLATGVSLAFFLWAFS